MNRETWLNQLANKMAPRFEELGFPLPKFRVSIGFTSVGANGGANGQCWSDACTDDKHYTIFISPSEATSMDIAAILNHELIHAAVGLKEGHKGKFAAMMKDTGMARPFTHSIAGEGFKAWVQPFIDELGAIPHAQLKVRGTGKEKLFKKEGGGMDAADQGDGEPVNNLPKKQTTRLLKCTCRDESCGYTVRITRKWIDELGAPICPAPGHGQMRTDDNEAE
jgi:hypothetical protein